MVDVVTVPNLSEHLSSATTTAQLSARFSYAAAMKSLNNLLLLGDGETWSRQKVDFSGLPEMVRTFLQVAAGAADIPVTRLLGQSPSGMSATGESDTRNYYDMVSARQELDLRPQLERLDKLILRSAGVDPAALSFEFRPLWQMDAAQAATIALQKAQASQIYAGLGLWPAATTAKLVEAQLAEDGIYPGAEGIFAEAVQAASRPTADFNFNPAQLRDPNGQWSKGGGGPRAPDGTPIILAGHHHEEEERETGGLPPEPVEEPDVPLVPLVPNLLKELPGSNGPPAVYPPLIAKPVAPVPKPLTTPAPAISPRPSGELAKPVTPLTVNSLAQVPANTPSLPLSNATGSSPSSQTPSVSYPSVLAPIARRPDGSFFITDWTGYPEGQPKPEGPFRLLQGDEYTAARKAADQANRRMHDANPALDDLEIHEMQPVKFGGSPTDLSNKMPLTKATHRAFTEWWARLQHNIEK